MGWKGLKMRNILSPRSLSIPLFMCVFGTSGLFNTTIALAAEAVPSDSWVILEATGTYSPAIKLDTTTAQLAVGPAPAICTDGYDSVAPSCTVSMTITLDNIACGIGSAVGSASATVTIGSDVDTYSFGIVVMAVGGAMAGTVVEDGATAGRAGGVLEINPSPLDAITCGTSGLQTVSGTAAAAAALETTI